MPNTATKMANKTSKIPRKSTKAGKTARIISHAFGVGGHCATRMVLLWRCLKLCYRQQDFGGFRQEFSNFFLTSPQSANVIGGRTMANGGQECIDPPHPQKRGKLVSWTPKTSVASFKSNLPAQPDFFGNSPRPPYTAK
jgi:hypothetical protein